MRDRTATPKGTGSPARDVARLLTFLRDMFGAWRLYGYASSSRGWAAVQFGRRHQRESHATTRSAVRALLDAEHGPVVCASLPFEMHSMHPDRDTARTDVFIPDLLLTVSGGGVSIEHDSTGTGTTMLAAFHAEEDTGDGLPVRSAQIGAIDDDMNEADVLRFRHALDWVRAGQDRRMTVSRCVAVPQIDLLSSFAGAVPHGLGRAFVNLGGLGDFVGMSPELLAHGSTQGFTCYKLSGTAPRHVHGDPGAEGTLFQDRRLSAEHDGAIRGTVHALSEIGDVVPGRRSLLVRPSLYHLLTPLGCIPRRGTTIFDCLQAAQPSGTSPSRLGLEVLREIEPARGPYYGLTGMVFPDHRFTLSQVLRTVFVDDGEHRCWTRVGAAITALSTVEIEYDETRTKLLDVIPRAGVVHEAIAHAV